MARSPSTNRCATVPTVAGIFFPLRLGLRLDNHNVSPTVLALLVEATARLQSFSDAAFALQLAGISISSRQVQRIAAEIGTELAKQRDDKAAAYARRDLPARVAATPEVVAVEVDGGRVRTREEGCGPGVHQPQHKEDKIACLVSLHSPAQDQDPQPEPPPSFVQPRRVQRLVQQMRGGAGELPDDAADALSTLAVASELEEAEELPRPHKRVRTCVASMVDSHGFGPLVAAEAQERDFFRAGRRAYLGDGAAYNWWIQRAYFPDFEPITDLLHVLCYLYLAAWATSSDEAERWRQYEQWLRACWQGRVAEVIDEMRVWQGRLGEPPKGEQLEAQDPRRLLAEALRYLENNQSRMDYPRYRQQGLPITSSLVESLVGQFNARVKGKQKYWNRPSGAEAMLQLRAAVLSEDERLTRFFAQRPGNPYRRRKSA